MRSHDWSKKTAGLTAFVLAIWGSSTTSNENTAHFVSSKTSIKLTAHDHRKRSKSTSRRNDQVQEDLCETRPPSPTNVAVPSLQWSQAQEDGRQTPPPSSEEKHEQQLGPQSQEDRNPVSTRTGPNEITDVEEVRQPDTELHQHLFDAGKRDLFYTLTRSKDRTSPKTAVLNLATMQRLSLLLLQQRLALYAAHVYTQDEISTRISDAAQLQELLNLYCEGVRNLDFMKDAALRGYDRDPFLLKSSRALERQILEFVGLIPDHVLPAGPLPMALDEDDPQLAGETSRQYANRIAAKERRLLRLFMAASGGLLIIVPMLIMVNVPGKVASVVTTCVAIAVFVALVPMVTDLGPKDVLGTTAAYAAVLVVFVGTSLERR